ncbi:MAG TPA: NAD-dependent epimerase/dehydratase family protein [Nannocystaceae bacterium]|nr:NAD-dependent epimerase/dehydratase family protein [Nannocystaceae bacterium]
MKVALVGGAGFIGRATATKLIADGHEVVVISRSASRRALPGVIAVDADAMDVPASALADVDALVNLVGIKMPQGDNDFARAHERTVAALLAAAEHAGITRFIHVGVVSPPGASGPYHDSKRRGEQLVRDSGLHWTIVRPSVVYGPGDDMLTHLVEQIRVAPVFPIPGGALGPLMPVDVRDVAEAIARALQRDAAIDRVYDVVGPEPLDVRRLVWRVAAAIELPILAPTVPRFLMRPLAAIAERVLADPPVTTSQLEMLRTGLPGDGGAAARDLELSPRAMSNAYVAEIAAQVPVRLPSLRLVTSAEHRAWLRRIGDARAWRLLVIVMVAMLAMPWLLRSVWPRMAAIEGLAAASAIMLLGLPWRELLRPSVRAIAGGVVAGIAMWAVGWNGVAILRWIAPSMLADLPAIHAWGHELSRAVAIPLMFAIVAAEDIVWRGAIGLAAVARFGPVLGCIVGGLLFALAHTTSGPPLLWLAAFVCGTIWIATTIRTRSLVPTIAMHATFDLFAMFVWRYR